MPVAAIAVAAVAIGSALPAIAAIGTAAFTIGDALAITAAVGATVGAVGVVTKDKGLMTSGMILGGIGGVGSLAASAGFFDSGASFSSLFSDSGGAAAADIPSSVAISAGTPGVTTAASTSGESGLMDSISGASSAATTPSIAGTEATTGLTGASAGDTLPSVADSTKMPTEDSFTGGVKPNIPTQTPVQPVPVAPNAALAPPTPAAPTTFQQSLTQAGAANVPMPPSTEPPGVLDSLGNFLKNDKSGMVSYGLIQAGGSLIGGLFDPLKPAQVSQLNAQTAQTQAQTGITQTQAANIKAPLPVAKTGMINSYGAAQ